MEAIQDKLDASLQLLREDNKAMIELLKSRHYSSSAGNENLRLYASDRELEPARGVNGDTLIKSVDSSQVARSRLARDRLLAAGF